MLLIQSNLPIDSVLVEKASVQTPSYAQLLKEGDFEQMLDKFLTWGIDFAGRLLIAIIIFLIGRFLISKIKNLVSGILNKRIKDIALRGFLQSLVLTIGYIILIMFIINTVGTKTVSIAALIASAGLAIGLAVKDNLANFAGGVMILLNKPFKGGDFINAQNMEGTVESIGVLYTMLKTPDNKTIYIPNGPLSTGNIINYNSRDKIRRSEIVVGVEYGSDVEEVKNLLLEIAQNHPNVLENPKPFARMTKMNDNSIDFSFRVWITTENYWGTTFDLNEQIYTKLIEKGIEIPFPQMTVHLANQNEPGQ